MTSIKKGQNVDFIVATHQDDAGALTRISAISSAFPLARIIIADSSDAEHKKTSRLKDVIRMLGGQASYVSCNVGRNMKCTYTCYQQALAHVKGDYVVFRTTDKLMDEHLMAANLDNTFDEDLIVLDSKTAANSLDKAWFSRDFITRSAPFEQPDVFNETAFLMRAKTHARCRIVRAAA